MDLDDTALKAEIDQIAVKIDDIMKKVNRLYPQQELKSTADDNTSQNAVAKQSLP